MTIHTLVADQLQGSLSNCWCCYYPRVPATGSENLELYAIQVSDRSTTCWMMICDTKDTDKTSLLQKFGIEDNMHYDNKPLQSSLKSLKRGPRNSECLQT